MRGSLKIAVPAFWLSLLVLIAMAAASQVDPRQEAQMNELVQPKLNDPSSESDMQLEDDFKFNLSAIRDKTSVTASVGFRKKDFVFNIQGIGPIGEKADDAQLANLDGINAGFNFSVGFSYIFFDAQPPNQDKIKNICLAYAEKRFGGTVPDGFCNLVKDTTFVEFRGVSAEEAESYRHSMRLAAGIDEEARRKNEMTRICKSYAKARFGENLSADDFCKELNPEKLVASEGISKKDAEGFLAQSYTAVDRGTVWVAGARFEGNRVNFNFADPESLEETKEIRNGRAFVASVGLLTESDNFFALHLRNETSYQGGKKSEICVPFGDENLQCKDLVLGAPTEKDREVATFEYRRFFGESFAINPKASYVFDDDTTKVEFPLYFLRGKGGLLGGLKVEWNSDDKDIEVGAFVGTALKLAGIQ